MLSRTAAKRMSAKTIGCKYCYSVKISYYKVIYMKKW